MKILVVAGTNRWYTRPRVSVCAMDLFVLQLFAVLGDGDNTILICKFKYFLFCQLNNENSNASVSSAGSDKVEVFPEVSFASFCLCLPITFIISINPCNLRKYRYRR